MHEHMKAIRREQPEWFGRIPEATKREVALGRLRSAIRTNLALPGFEKWSKRDQQPGLF